MPSPPVKMKVLSILAENSWKTEMKLSRSVLFHMETRVSLRYFVTYCMLAFFFSFIRTVFTFKANGLVLFFLFKLIWLWILKITTDIVIS